MRSCQLSGVDRREPGRAAHEDREHSESARCHEQESPPFPVIVVLELGQEAVVGAAELHRLPRGRRRSARPSVPRADSRGRRGRARACGRRCQRIDRRAERAGSRTAVPCSTSRSSRGARQAGERAPRRTPARFFAPNGDGEEHPHSVSMPIERFESSPTDAQVHVVDDHRPSSARRCTRSWLGTRAGAEPQAAVEVRLAQRREQRSSAARPSLPCSSQP